jgi:hypothetical protein
MRRQVARIAWLTFLALWFVPWVAVLGGLCMAAEAVIQRELA